jgi:uncharacterized coiled-coil protein SlyX
MMKEDKRGHLKIKIADQAKRIEELEAEIFSMNDKCVKIRRLLEGRIKELEDGITSMNNEWVKIRRALEARIRELEYALGRIDNWAKAYPLKVFPEPDFKKVAEVLKAAGLNLDAVSASNMRHVISQVKDITETALKGKDADDEKALSKT